MGGVGDIEHQGSLRAHRGGGAEVDRRRRVIADARVAMVMVVEVEEAAREDASVLG